MGKKWISLLLIVAMCLTGLVLSMAAELSLKVVAEGVETQAQADFLLKHQCDSLQGFLFF